MAIAIGDVRAGEDMDGQVGRMKRQGDALLAVGERPTRRDRAHPASIDMDGVIGNPVGVRRCFRSSEA